ncbi:cysteine--tRNA ligase [Candidatus Saccharibacteria bacterium]|nr:cysteine--tRNA ligase [Candidatus Saccharibacteria bacterium]
MKLYNTPERKVVDFEPIEKGHVKIYTCGPTVYSYQHIGNYTAYIYWDILVRTLELHDYRVRRVLNMTDVGHLVSDEDEGEDKMEKGARLSEKTVWEVAEYYSADFLKNFRKLGLLEPTVIARATDYIEENLEMVATLKEKGFAYQIDDGIYFDTSKFARYADFAKLDLENLRAGARVEFNEMKRNVTDFALWKFVRPGEKHDMQWETPVELLDGDEVIMGYPGWAIECSAIIKKELGDTIDIHTGGIDHIPVHHTNEIAQSESANGVKFSNYWLHCDFITVDGQKISKSLGNIYTLDDLNRKKFSHEDFKMWVLQGHYQSERNFSFENLEAAKNRLRSWKNAAALRHQINDTVVRDTDKNSELMTVPRMITGALSDNLNTPLALAMIDGVFTKLESSNLENVSKKSLVGFLEFVERALGVDLIETTPDIDEDLKRKILARERARTEKNFKEADRLREEIEAEGIVLRDALNRTLWEYGS